MNLKSIEIKPLFFLFPLFSFVIILLVVLIVNFSPIIIFLLKAFQDLFWSI